MRSEIKISSSNLTKMQSAAFNEDQNGSQAIQPDDSVHAETEPSITAFSRAQTRGEGIEAEDGNNTITNNDADV